MGAFSKYDPPSKGSARDYNLLIIMSDQHRENAARCYGHAGIRTPNLDRLARAGTRFSQVYCQSPLCAPSRGSFLTGLHCHTCGALTQKTPIKEELPTIASIFRDAGYETAGIGKMHIIGESATRDLGFTHRALRYYADGMRDYIEAVGERKARIYNPGWKEFLKACYNPNNKSLDLEEQDTFDATVVERSIEFMQRFRSSRFLLFVGLEKPHPYWYAPAEYHRIYSPDSFVPPGAYNQRLQDVPASLVKRQEYLGALDFSKEEVAGSIAAYYANVTFLDSVIGRLLDALDKLDLTRKTLVVYTSDHGELLFEHGLVQKHCFFEAALRVPLIFAGGALFPASATPDFTVSLLDLFPTFMDLFDLPRPDGLEGESLLPFLTGSRDSTGRAAFSEYYWTSPPARMVRTGKWKYVYTEREAAQLYDLENDPGEMVNLALDETFRSKGDELQEIVLDGWEIPELDIDLTAIESRYREKKEYLRSDRTSFQ